MQPPPLPPKGLHALATEALIEKALDEPAARRACMVTLRDRDELRAQAAAALLCFDLAKGGDDVAQGELALLRPTLDALAADPDAADELLADPPALQALWEAAQEVLEQADPRDFAPVLRQEVDAELSLDLLGDDDAPELGNAADEARVRAEELRRLLAEHLGVDAGERRVVRLGKGLAMSTPADVDRVEAFLREVDARAHLVPAARGLSCLGHLFVATHLRRHNVFGALNPRRAAAVRAGLARLARLDAEVESVLEAAAFFAFEGEHTEGFEKVIELMLDYLAFAGEAGADPYASETASAYAAAGRLPPPVLGGPDRRRR